MLVALFHRSIYYAITVWNFFSLCFQQPRQILNNNEYFCKNVEVACFEEKSLN